MAEGRRMPPPVDNKWAPPGVPGFDDTETMDDRALSLGDDSAGGYLVPKQLDGTKKAKKK